MTYVLGVDLGTTFSAAAVDVDGRSEIFQLGSRSAVIPSVVLLRADGETLTGEAAERRALTEPARTAREFKRRLGDPTPMILGGTPYGAESVLSVLLKAILDQVKAQRGEEPSLVCITHPASYGPYKIDLLQQAVRQAGVSAAMYLTEPEAAALHYASQERIEAGSVVAVYDFGGGTFDAAVLRKTEDGFQLLGQPEGMERLGGIDFDEAIFQHVVRSLDGRIEELDPHNSAAQAGVARLREECQRAKEAVSSDTEAVIPVLLPNVQTEIRITRSEFEDIIGPRIRETVTVLERSVKSAGLKMEDVDRILLVGGTSRIPLVSATVRDISGRPVAVDTHPKHAIALGAALEGRRRLDTGLAEAVPATAGLNVAESKPAVPLAPASAASTESLPAAAAGIAAPTPDPRPVPHPGREATTMERSRPPWLPIGIAAAALAAVGIVVFMVLAGGGDGDNDPAAAEPTEAPSATATETLSTATTAPAAVATQPAVTPTLAPNTSRINAITVANARYQVVFEVAGFSPNITAQHVHFFFDTVPPAQAGVPGRGPWFVYGGGSPFTGYSVAERPAGANKMCILVANPDHSVIANTGNCVDLP